MLRSYPDVCGPGERGAGSGEVTDDRLLLMSEMWHEGSYAELERCLRRMRDDEHRLYWHVAERYLRCRRRQTLGCPECRQATAEGARHRHADGFGKARPVDRSWIIAESWSVLVQPVLVERGVHWLSACHEGEPWLPQELYALVAA